MPVHKQSANVRGISPAKRWIGYVSEYIQITVPVE